MNKRIIIHLVAWVFIFFFWFSIYYYLEPTVTVTLALTANCVLFSIITYYIVTLFLLPQYLYKKRYIALAVSFMIFLISAGSLYAWAEFMIYEKLYKAGLNWNYVKLVYNSYIQLFYVAAIAGCIQFFNDRFKAENNLARLKAESAQNELKFLRAQLNPHFMFNSLNTIYFQIPKESSGARDSLLTFSNLLRYQLYECNVDKISIGKEIMYIKNFVDLQRQRKKSNYQFTLDQSGIKDDFLIAPLVIITFVENAFKFVSNHKDQNNVINIRMEGCSAEFRLSVYNTKDLVKDTGNLEYKGIGLSNVQRRLELLYPDKYELSVKESATSYSVDLNIRL